MPEFSNTRRVRHSAAHMFDLVADVERYPEFVPLCRSLKVRKRIPQPEGVEVLIADMTVAYRFVRETFRYGECDYSLHRTSRPDDERAMGGPIIGVSAASGVVARRKFMRNEIIADREIEDLLFGFTGRKDPLRWVKSDLRIADPSGRPTYIDLEGARTIILGQNRGKIRWNCSPMRRPVTNHDGH